MDPYDVAANLIADGEDHEGGLPAPWTFDGTRRLYTEGKPTGWIARAVDTTNPELGMEIPLTTGEGDSPMSATIDLVSKLNQ